MDCTISKKNRIIPIISLFLVIALLLCLFSPVKAQAVAGFDDAIFWSILNQTFMSAAGANFVVGSNGVPATEADPITESILQDLYTKGELDRKFYEYVGQEFSTFVDTIDWDNVFSVASGTSNIIANLPKVAVDTLTLFAKGLITELGATSDSSIDWNTSNGNIVSDTSCNVGEYSFVKCPSTINGMTVMGKPFTISLTGNSEDVFIAVCGPDGNQKHMFFAFSLGSFTFADRYCEIGSSGFAFYDFYGANYYKLYGYNSDLNFPSIPRDYMTQYIVSNYNPDTSIESMDYTLVPDVDVESMNYPETAVADYPNVESIPYYTDIPYTGTIPDTGVIPYTEAIPYLQEAVQSNTLTASLEATQEGTVTVPDGSVTIPLFNITLPDFDFNFNGIWYYVVQWVNSLGAWFSQMFTIWGILPAPMVYPVWATAVIVIVLGVYKRFFM